MKYEVCWPGSMNTSVATVIESMPRMMLSGALTYVSVPLKVSPSPPPQLAVPLTVPFLPLPDASATADAGRLIQLVPERQPVS